MPGNYTKKFLVALGDSFLKALPNKTSQNSYRIQFAFMFSLLLVYAWTKKIYLIPTCILRTAEEQFSRYQKGRTMPGKIVTNTDGYKKKSRHQRWRAGDILILAWDGRRFQSKWRPREPYEILGEFWEDLGGTWGGRWKERGITAFDDPYHFQI